jgi:hypothetical protein
MFDDATIVGNSPGGIRAELRKWEQLHGAIDPMADFKLEGENEEEDGAANLSHLPDLNDVRPMTSKNQDSTGDEKMTLSRRDTEVNIGLEEHHMLHPGDVVELAVHKSGKTLPAVHVRPVGEWGVTGQFINIYGRTCYANYNGMPWHSRRWMDPELIKPLVPYLPDIQKESQILELKEISVFEEVDVPRDISAPIVARLNSLKDDIDEIYRRNADALDRAHDILAHPTDLRYGSLSSITRALLNILDSEVSIAATLAVRRALANGGIAFHREGEGHRLSGHVQIISKQDLKAIENVREWMRSWQDFVSRKDNSNQPKPAGATIIDSFVAKARAIVLRSREHRLPQMDAHIGPCKTQRAITESQGAFEEKFQTVFDLNEQAIGRFLFEWAASRRFWADSSLSSLPPLLMHATGCYDDVEADINHGYLFLQELGIVGPFQGGHSFMPSLLLPTSGQSRPLSNLMNKLEHMGTEEVEFPDAMKHLRHDWGDTPIFCIDDAGAAEIDDGLSVEHAGVNANGEPEYWYHVHVANPTAFFDRHHPIAKMARHMGETVYTPEYAHTMLPTWLTQRYFSLAKDRPVITFSARMDEAGNTLERRVRNGIARNVLRITYDDLDRLLESQEKAPPQAVLSTGKVPPSSPTVNDVDKVTTEMLGQLRLMDKLGRARMSIRKARGGQLYSGNVPSISVNGHADRPGLGPSVPYFKGARATIGDPVVTLRTSGMMNMFIDDGRPSNVVVREGMLLACEVSAQWCAERHIPVLFRGIVPHPLFPHPDKYYREHVLPNVGQDGAISRHLGRKYLQMLGYGVMRTTPTYHRTLGLDVYTKATSPLRRYGDLILHWQIEAALRHEADTGISLVDDEPISRPGKPSTSRDRSFLPLTAEGIELMIPSIKSREQMVVGVKVLSNEYWLRMLLWRKHHYPDVSGGPISDTFRKLHVVIEQGLDEIYAAGELRGIILEFGIKTRISVNSTHANAGIDPPQPGEIWECMLSQVVMTGRITWVIPTVRVKVDGANDYTSWRKGTSLEADSSS